MSLEAYVWAAQLPLHACSAAGYRVLLMLADRADQLGYGCYPQVSTMADILECSPRTIQRGLRELEELGLIRKGDQRYVEHLDGRYRPTVYDVLTPALKYAEQHPSTTKSRGDSSVTPKKSRGDRFGRSGVTTVVAHKNRPYNPLTKTSSEPYVGERAREAPR